MDQLLELIQTPVGAMFTGVLLGGGALKFVPTILKYLQPPKKEKDTDEELISKCVSEEEFQSLKKEFKQNTSEHSHLEDSVKQNKIEIGEVRRKIDKMDEEAKERREEAKSFREEMRQNAKETRKDIRDSQDQVRKEIQDVLSKVSYLNGKFGNGSKQ